MPKAIEQDLALVDVLISVFKDCYSGSDNAVKTDKLLFKLTGLNVYVSPAMLRDAIGHIRKHDMLAPGFILSDVSYGYWLSYEHHEQDDFIEKMLNRMANQFQNLQSLHKRVRHGKNTSNTLQPTLF
jgi:hypothetical protein